NTDGFAFDNGSALSSRFGGYDIQDFVELFGWRSVFGSIDLCWPFGCDVPAPYPDPLVLVLLSATEAFTGNCFGFCLGSQRILTGYKAITDFPFSTSTPTEYDIWHLAAADSRGNFVGSSNIKDYIHLLQLTILSGEFLDHLIRQSGDHLTASSSSIYSDID